MPWKELVTLIQSHAPVSKTDIPPFPVSAMMRIHFMKQWFGLSDPAMEETLHDMALFREFVQLDAGATRGRMSPLSGGFAFFLKRISCLFKCWRVSTPGGLIVA